jgi:hypothetical protein
MQLQTQKDVIVKNTESSTLKNQESGKENGCSAQTEQPYTNASERDSDTEKKLENCKEKRKHIILPFRF